MKTKVFKLLVTLFVAALPFSFASCGGDDDDNVDPNANPGGTIDPSANVPDPAGTIELSMRREDQGDTFLDESNIHINNSDNFEFDSGWSYNGKIASYGAVKGLGNVSNIPTNGWADEISVKPGYGYVAYLYNKNSVENGQYYRFYVVDYITTAGGSVIGADVKYQKPFYGKDEAIQIEEKAITFGAEGGVQSIVFANDNIVVFDVESDAGWLSVSKSSTLDPGFLFNAITIGCEPSNTATASEGTITLTTAYKKKVTIKVTRQGQAPFFEINPEEETISSEEQTGTVGISTNYNLSDITISGAPSWLKTELTDASFYMRRKAAAVRSVALKDYDPSIETGARAYTLLYRAESNLNEDQRTATLTLKTKDGKFTKHFKVTQDGITISGPKEVFFDRTQSNYTVSISSNGDWTVPKSNQTWCTVSRNGNNLTIRCEPSTADRTATLTFPGIKSYKIVVRQSKYAVGDEYSEGKVTGKVCYMDNSGLRLIYREFGVALWSTEKVTTGATDRYDGEKNMAVIRAIPNFKTLYPAFALVESLNTDGVTGWYMPACEEKGKPSLSYNYWSSTEGSTSITYSSDGTLGDKIFSRKVVAICKF
ncbi:MAG: DUF5036 family protein [Bacteroidaceae bacterium]|nr:DUF5036 family protein [Bacteroidaceae bacterium]